MQFEAIQDLFDRTAAAHAGKPALEWQGESLTYRELAARSNRLARQLIEAGVAPGALVAILADDPFVLVPSLIGVLKAGAGFVPLDPTFPERRLARMVERTAPPVLLTQPALRELGERLSGGASRVVSVSSRGGSGDTFDLSAGPADRPAGIATDPDSRAYVYFTSGSTGEPKGIEGRLRAIDHFIRWEIETLGLGPGTRVSQLTTPSFDAYLRDVFVPLCCGGVACVPEGRRLVLDGRQLVDWLDLEEIAVLHCVPSVFRSLLAEELKPSYFQALRYVLMAGEPLLPSDVARWMEVFGSRVQLVNLYGPSETTMTKFFHLVQPEDRERRSVPIGRPIRGARALLLDAQKKVCPPNSVGEIYIRTPFRALGYLDNPEATREAFVQNPFNDAPDDLVFRTGDMARTLPNGDFEFLGRRDQQVKIQGVRVELGEIESLLRRQAGVRDGVVVDREDGAGGKALFAYVVLDEGVETESLRRALGESLPEAMMPAAFVVMEELPRTLTGKVDRRALPDPSRALAVEDADLAAPSTPTEELLASAWCDLLRLKSVGIHQSFFDLGGHSLLVTQLLSRVRASFGLILPLDSVFEDPTIAGLARKIDQQLRAGAGAAMPPLVPTSREQDPPLSFAQERLWVLDRLDPGNPAYNVPSALELKGPLDVAALRQGLNEIVRRHESLRTTFRVRDGRPVQRIHPPGPVSLPVVDLSGLPEGRREEEGRLQTAEEAVARFDLARDTVLRARLLRLAAERALLLVTLHHIGSDDWSASLLVDEWAAAYTAYAAGRAPALPPLPVQYADFAAWQRQWLSGEVLASLLDFWRGEMAGVAPLTDLPLDRPRPAQATYRGARQPIQLSRELSERLRALSRREGSTLFMTLMAALQALLWRHGAQDAFAVGSPVAGRHHVEVEKLIGFFINNVVVRSDFAEGLSFRESLARMRRTVLAAFAHQDLPFEKLVEALRPERNPSFAPVFQVAFALHNARREELSEIPGLALSRVVGDVELVKADLDLDLIEIDERVVGNLLFRTDLFDPATARRLAVHLERLLEAVTADPAARIADLPLLDPEEVRHLLSDWQGQPAPEPALFPDLIAQWAAREPERVAVEHRGEKLTYGELDRRGNQLARYLRSLGVGPETIVASAMDRGPEMITGLLGILRAGGAYLPLDPAYPSERLEMMLQDAGVSVLLTQDHVAAELPVFFGFPLSLDSAWGLVAAESDEPLEPVVGPDNLAYVIYTSGSTGRPKGVLVTHGGLAWVTPLYTRLAGPDQRVLQFASPGFDASIAEIVTALGSGSTLVTASQSEMAPGPDLTRLLREQKVSLVTLPPSTLAVTPAGELPELTTLIAAGEALTSEVVERWSAPGRRLLNFYGPTEGTIWASAADCGPGEAPSIGLPIPGATLHLLDPRGELAPPGVAGAVFLGGSGVTRGYLNRPDLTAERFVPDPLSDRPGARRYRTGDLARRRGDGRIEFLGRVDQQVKLRGFRVELGEVEAVLAQHPGVESAVVLVRPGGDRLSAYWTAVQPAGPAAPAADDLRDYLAQRLPAHAVPVEWIALPELPRNANGKVDRRALAALGGADMTRSRSYRAPEEPLEELVAGIFSEVLGVERVGADDDFFQLGGYSLAGAQVASRIEELLGFEVPMDRLFNCPSPARLGRELRRTLLQQNAPAAAPPLVPDAGRQGDLPLTFGQELMWLDYQQGRQEPESSDAHVTWCLRLSGELDAEALGRALDEVRRRHEVLRTAILESEGSAVQRVLPFQPEPLPLEDLRDVPEESRMAALRRSVLRFRAEPFDLASGRVMRWQLYSLDEADHVLAIVCHHIVSDPWSAHVFSHELTGLYRAFAAGEPSPLAELPVQMGDFALWQRRWMADEACARRLDFWRQRLAGAVPVELPLEAPRTALRAAPMASHHGELPDRLVQDLTLLSRESGATLFMALLAAFDVLLYQLTGERDLAVWSPMGKRSRPEIEPLIGFFPHGTVLRCELPEGAAFRAVLAEVRRTTLDALSHQDIPYEILSSRLLPELRLGRELMRVSANFIRTPGTLVDLPGLRVTALELSAERRMQGDLEILFREVDGRLHYNLNYRTDRFDAATVSAWAERYEALLTAIADDPDQRLDDLRERIEKVIGTELAELPGVFA